MTMQHKGTGYFRYLRSGLTVLLGAGATLGGSFLISRLKEKQDAESRMDRLEQMIDDLEGRKPQAPAAESTKPKRQRAPKK